MRVSGKFHAMSRWLLVAWVLALECNGSPTARARFLDRYTPDEFVERADAVCNGVVVAVNQTEETALLWYDKNNPGEGGWPVCYVVARVRIISQYKGNVPAEIRVRYAVLDRSKADRVIVDGPDLIDLQPGMRCRFYLRSPEKTTGDCYVGIVDGTADEARAVEPLVNGVLDDDPPFLQARAGQIAVAYVRRVYPRYVRKPDDLGFDYLGGTPCWWVRFAGLIPGDSTPYFPDASVMLTTSGEVMPQSWIARGRTESQGHGLRKYLGKWVLLSTKPKHDKKDPTITQIGAEYRGRIGAVSGTGFSGKFVKDWPDKPETMTFLRRDIDYIRELVPPAGVVSSL